MPPAGGFEMIRYKRNLPARGVGAYTILAGVSAVMFYGCWQVAKAKAEQLCVCSRVVGDTVR